MQFDLENPEFKGAYKLLTGLVTPRPIAFITTLSANGVVNAAPFSFFNLLGSKPPIVAFAPSDYEDGTPKDTARNVRGTHEFVVNMVDESIAAAMHRCSSAIPYGESELKLAGLTVAPSSTVKTPRIAEALVSLECEEWGTLHIVENRIVIGKVRSVYVADGVVDPVTLYVNRDRYKTVGRMQGPGGYTFTRETFEFPPEKVQRTSTVKST